MPASSGVEIFGPEIVLESRFDVTGLATIAVAEASSAVAELLALRTGEALRPVAVDRVGACAAFAGERLFRPAGWQLPPIWDPIAGDYPTADGWIRLHTNYANHRAAALRALGVPGAGTGRDEIAAAVARRSGEDLESTTVDAGGAAAILRSAGDWLHTRPGRSSRNEHLTVDPAPPVTGFVLASGEQPLAGVRVLDLTRVIAGPVCTRFLAAYGADVLRIDPPGFVEVPALVPEVTAGKRCAALDLRSPAGRLRFSELIGQAHVVVSGLRPGALQGLGFGPDRLRELNPGLITARLNAYGWEGPWSGRRGFDSLVQMSCGIAHLDAESAPSPLPVQALDHASGYFLAAAVCRALAELVRTGVPSDIRTSLVATANRLMELPVPAGSGRTDPDWPDELFEAVPTAWGPARRVRVPGTVDGVVPAWSIDAGPLGRHEAAFG